MSITVMKQALEALEHGLDYAKSEQFENAQRYKGYERLAPDDAHSIQLIETAITSLRQAIVVYESAPPECQTEAEKTAYAFGWWKAMEARQAEKQEPVAYWNGASKFALPKAKEWDKRTGGTTAFGIDIPLYTHQQPKREPLTDEEIAEFFGVKAVDESFVDFVRAIEAAHGIKENT